MKSRQVYQLRRARYGRTSGGFTLIESLIAAVLLALLAAIGAPSFTGWLSAHRLTLAQREIHSALRQAQTNAVQTKSDWQLSIREGANSLEWAIHPRQLTPTQQPVWQRLESSIQLDDANTTLMARQGVHYVYFGYTGDVQGRLGRVTFTTGGRNKRCVIVSTLIGALRQGQQHSTPDDSGRYCY